MELLKKNILIFLNIFSITNADARSALLKKNIKLSFVYRIVNIAIGYILIPLTLDYLSPERYGIWLTLSSITAWLNLFDIGLGNGLRNKLAIAIAKTDTTLGQKYVSTTYALLSIVAVVILLLLVVVNHFINWHAVFNTYTLDYTELKVMVLITVSYFAINFVLKILNSVMLAYQDSSRSNGVSTLVNVITLVSLFFFSKTVNPTLVNYSTLMAVINIGTYVFISVYYYKKYYIAIVPSFATVDFGLSKDLFNLGFKFFFLQAAGIIVFATDNILITQFFSAADVVPYNIAYKYFNIITVVFYMIATPLWSAYTDAFEKKDTIWIKQINYKLIRFWFLLLLATIAMVFLAKAVYHFWIGEKIVVPFILNLLMGVYVLTNAWVYLYTVFLSGIGKITIGLYVSVFACIINIPLAYYFCKYLHMGMTGVLLANIVSLLPDVFLTPYQYKKIISGTATGIWNK